MSNMLRQHLALDQILASLREHKKVFLALQERLFLHAQLQEHTENQYDTLASLVEQQMLLLSEAQLDDLVTSEWLRARDELLKKLEAFIPPHTT